jgi:hypothetical protein
MGGALKIGVSISRSIPDIKAISQVKTGLNFNTIGQTALIALALAAVAAFVGIRCVKRSEPMKILPERT